MQDYSTEEKIDYIFKELKSQKKIRIGKMILKLIIIIVGIYIYFNFIKGIDKERLISDFSTNIGKIVQPITENIINNMVKENSADINNIDVNSISPEMIEQIKKLNK